MYPLGAVAEPVGKVIAYDEQSRKAILNVDFFRNKPLIITIIIVVLLILLIVGTMSSNRISEPTTVVGGAFVPVQRFFYQLSDKVFGVFQDAGVDQVQENEQMRRELDEYKVRLMDYNELVAENERLAAALEYKQNHRNQQLKLAKIIGKEPGNWFSVFTIDLGSKDGVEENMAVITPDGLVGRVEEVGLNWSKVMAIVDGRSNVSAIMERTRDVGVAGGMVAGDALNAVLTMSYLPLDSDIVEGDVVVTSGLDEMFPKGFVIGTVAKMQTHQDSSSITIKPSVDFRRLSEVMIVMESEDTATVVSQDIADQGAVAVPLEDDNTQTLNDGRTSRDDNDDAPDGQGTEGQGE